MISHSAVQARGLAGIACVSVAELFFQTIGDATTQDRRMFSVLRRLQRPWPP